MNAIVEAAPKAPANAPDWAIRLVQDMVKWVQNRDMGPQQLTAYPTASQPKATMFPRALIYDSTLNVPAYSDISGVWHAIETTGGYVPGTRLVSAGTGLSGGGDLTADRTISLTVPTASGTYTPTLTNTANISSSSALQCQYMRVGNVVTVSGGVAVTPTLLATLTTLGLSLPIASNIGAAENLGGAANSSAVVSASAAVFGDAVNDRATFQMISVGTGSEPFYFSFTYLVI